MAVPRLKLELVQGATFNRTFYWYSGTPVTKAISAVAPGYPTVVTATAHGLPNSAIPVGVVGAGWLNTASLKSKDLYYGTKLTADTLSIPFDSTGKTSLSSGVLVYTPPVDLSGYSARMQIRPSVSSSTIIKALATSGQGITLGSDGSIAIKISDTDTSGFTFTTAVSQLEVVSGSGDVTRLFEIDWTLSPESTR